MMSLRDRLFRHVDVLAGLRGEWNSRTSTAIEAAKAYLQRELTEMGYCVEEQPYGIGQRTTLINGLETHRKRSTRSCRRS